MLYNNFGHITVSKFLEEAMALINVMEQLVSMKIQEMLPGYNCCTCDECVDDIKALALNKLPPKYVNSNKGELFSRLDSIMIKQHNVDLNVAVIAAIEFVCNHPRHEVKPKTEE